jgi:hypothetical protein
MNVSSRHYDYSAFNGRVKDYEWPDHQAPPLTTLVQIAFEMYRYLKCKSTLKKSLRSELLQCTAITVRDELEQPLYPFCYWWGIISQQLNASNTTILVDLIRILMGLISLVNYDTFNLYRNWSNHQK